MPIVNLKFGDVIAFYPDRVVPEVKVAKENMSSHTKAPYIVTGIFFKKLDNGNIMLIDCFFWNGNRYEDGIAVIPKDKLYLLDYPPRGLFTHYFGIRKNNVGALLYERGVEYVGKSAIDELRSRGEWKLSGCARTVDEKERIKSIMIYRAIKKKRGLR